MDQDLFSKVSTEKLREKVYAQIVEFGPEIQIQLASKTLDSFVAKEQIKNELRLERKAGPPPSKTQLDVLASVIVGPDRYFIKTSLRSDDRFYYLKITEDIYKIQRRKNFRLSIPDQWQAQYELKDLNQKPLHLIFDLYDISLGGFSFEFDASNPVLYSMEDLANGVLNIPGKFELEADAYIRHERKVGSKTRVGLEFKNLGTKEEAKVQTLLMELHRVFFSRLQ